MTRLLTARSDGTAILDGLDPSDPALITELLRLDAPVQATARTATQNQLIGDVEIAAGQTVLVVVAAANRDPAVFDEPDQLRLAAAGPRRWPSATARITASVRLWRDSKPRWRYAESLRATPCGRARDWRDTPAIRGPLNVPMIFRSSPNVALSAQRFDIERESPHRG